MKLIVCLDNRDGMSFNGRRQSSDREVIRRTCCLAADNKLWMSAYSAKLFSGSQVSTADNCLQQAGPGEYCFAELTDLADVLPRAEALIVFRWNKKYPADTYLPPLPEHLQLRSTEVFSGNSHDEITQEVYTR